MRARAPFFFAAAGGEYAAGRARVKLASDVKLPRRRWLYWAIPVCAALAVLVASFGPAVRSRIAAVAARHDLDVRVGAVRPSWFGVRLLDVTASPLGMEGTRATFGEVRIGLSAGLRPSEIDLRDGSIELTGPLEALRRRLGSADPSQPSAVGTPASTPIRGRQIAVSWRDGARESEWQGVSFVEASGAAHVAAENVVLRQGPVHLALRELACDLGPDRKVTKVHANSATVTWERRAGAVDPLDSSPHSSTQGEAFPSLPEPHALRVRVATVSGLIAERMPIGSEVAVDQVTWQVGATDARSALTVGPGPFSVRRTPSHIEIKYNSGPGGDRASITLRALLPTDAGDSTVTVEGGPLALAVLGVHEGALGLVDVDRATIGGRATMRLAGDGTALTFDIESSARNLSLQQPRLASDLVRRLDVQLTARGVLDDVGTLRFDDVASTIGLLHVAGSGALQEHPGQLLASFHVDLPSTTCQSLMDSIPTALLPALQGTRWVGTFGARARFALDTQDPDALELSYDIQDQCRAVDVPPELARARFKQPFRQLIYLPDGTTAEQVTGPGSANWTPLADISPYMQVAVMTTEDGAFPYHHGFNAAAIKASIIADIKAGRFVRGASTISMQLAKNLFLTRQKTLARKLEEVVLTDYLEQVFSKDEIMELYLNVVEFGPAVYGITAASEYYFGRTPAELDVAESMFLSSLLPSPRRYGAMREYDEVPESWMRGLRNLMRIARKRHLLSDAELEEALAEKVPFWHGGVRPPARPPVRRRSPVDAMDSDADDPSQDAP